MFGSKLNLAAEIPDGIWEVACKDGLKKHQTILVQPSPSVYSVEEFFSDRNCQKSSFKFETTGHNEYFENEPTWVDFTFTSIKLTVSVPQVIEDFNQRKVCGFTDWQMSQARIITGLPCALFNIHKPTQIPRAGDKKFGIYKIEDQNKLIYGVLSKELDGSAPASRPKEFSDIPYILSE